MDIKIQVLGQKAKITNRHELYSGTVAIEGIQFEFSEEWENMTKTATVYVGSYDRDKAVNILIENNRVAPVQLPSELFEKNCELYVGVFGIDADGRRLTSSIVRQEIKKGVPVQNASDNVSIDVYTRIIQLMTEAKDIAADSNKKIESNKTYVEQATEQAEKSKQYAESAESHLADVETVAGNVSEMQKAIEELKTAAEQSASDASTSEQNASQSEQNALASELNAKKSEQNASKSATDASTSASNAKKSETAAATSEQNARKLTEQLTEDVSQLKESIVDLSDTKKEEISQKGLEVLQSIPADYSALSDATLIKPTVSGTDMVITDSSNMNIQELHLYGKTEQKTTKGKNLFDANTIFSTFIADGRATVMGEGVLINGTFGATSRNFSITLKKGTYYISGGGILHILDNGDSIFDKKIVVEDEEKTFQCYIASGTYTNKLIQPQIEIGSVATDYEPYTGGIASPNPEYQQEIESVENPTVSVGGRNLFNASEINTRPIYSNNCTYKYEESTDEILLTATKDGEIYIGSFADNKFNDPSLLLLIPIYANCRVKMSFKNNVFNKVVGNYLDTDKNVLSRMFSFDEINKSTAPEGTAYLSVRIGVQQAQTGVEYRDNVQIELGDTITDYETCKEIQTMQSICELNGIDDVKDELIIRANGTGQLIQRLLKEELNDNSDLRTWYENTNTYGYQTGESKWLFRENKINVKSNKLKGITKEVGNSGAYDENGIYVNTLGRINFKILKKYLTEYTVDALKTYLRDNPITVVGLLKEPIVNELTAEEVKKILALHTNKQNSTIWNDQNADMQITYVADAKNYIDNKFTELSNAIIASASETE